MRIDPPTPPAPPLQIRRSINVGDAHQDLGATITGAEADLNLGIHTFVDGVSMEPVVIDKTVPATHTIEYVVTDSAGLTSTSTLIVDPVAQ